MPLVPGTTLGTYQVVSLIGVGGMGEVYRARDTRLLRDVAIKVLPDSLAASPERLARLEREAQLLASLNHPNIAHVYGLEGAGPIYIAMELVEGEDLSQRIAAGALPVDEALPIAKQIADALEAAHACGVVHRDLKPANVIVRRDGTIKVLDFGLAKVIERPGGPGRSGGSGRSEGSGGAGLPDPSKSPTLTSPVGQTAIGVILGTAAYMAPEQARGRAVDKRVDIWAFGCVLFEMLSGRRPFDGEDVAQTLAHVISAEPDWAALPSTTPPAIRRLLRRALTKDPRARLHDIADARIEVQDAIAEPFPADAGRAAPRTSPFTIAVPWALFVVAAAAAAWLALRPPQVQPVAAPVTRSLVTFPRVSMANARGGLLTLSPDGTRLVYSADPDGTSRLYLRRLAQMEPTVIAGTDGALQPCFSPDGTWVAFMAGGKLKKVNLSGGAPVVLADAPSPFGVSWGDDDTLVFAPQRDVLMRVASAGGEPQVVRRLSPGEGQGLLWPHVLPGAQAVLVSFVLSPQTSRVEAISLADGAVTTVVESGAAPTYSKTGHLVYAHPTSEEVMAVKFDAARLVQTGKPVRLLQGVTASLYGADIALSDTGVLAYLPDTITTNHSLVWVDRHGAATPILPDRRGYGSPRIAPNGRTVAVNMIEGVTSHDIWMVDVELGALSRFTTEGTLNSVMAWTPDGRRLAFSSIRGTVPNQNIYWANADGSGDVELLLKSDALDLPMSWTPDGKTLLFYRSTPTTGFDLLTLPIDGERKPQPFAATRFDEFAGAVSPDGRWVAYLSNQSGRYEVYVQAFSGDAARQQVSVGGGTEPAWGRDGREIFYRQGDRMMVVDVASGSPLSLSKPRVLFSGQFETSFAAPGSRTYDVHPDGQRFVMIRSEPLDGPLQFVVVANWFEELTRLAP